MQQQQQHNHINKKKKKNHYNDHRDRNDNDDDDLYHDNDNDDSRNYQTKKKKLSPTLECNTSFFRFFFKFVFMPGVVQIYTSKKTTFFFFLPFFCMAGHRLSVAATLDSEGSNENDIS